VAERKPAAAGLLQRRDDAVDLEEMLDYTSAQTILRDPEFQPVSVNGSPSATRPRIHSARCTTLPLDSRLVELKELAIVAKTLNEVVPTPSSELSSGRR
jgi:hypothetical protein